jgi:hypothetical protein
MALAEPPSFTMRARSILLSSDVLKLRQSGSPFTAQRRAAAQRVDPRHAKVLELQRQAGNRAVAQMVAAQRSAAARPRIQRAMSTSARDLARYQSISGTGTYARIVKVVRDFDGARDPQIQSQLASLIRALCNVWLKDHPRPTSRRERTQHQKIELLEAESAREVGVLAAQAKYLEGFDANAAPAQGPRRLTNQAAPGPGAARPVAAPGQLPGVASNGRGYLQAPFDPNQQFGQFGAMSVGTSLGAAKPARALARGDTDTSGGITGAGKSAVRYASKYKLSAAEIAAIRTYSFPDYAYINPATGANRARVEQNIRGSDDMYFKRVAAQGDAGFDKAMQEGSMHAGVLMQALAKISPYAKKGYRGERVTKADFNSRYLIGKTVPGTNKMSGKPVEVDYNRFGSASKKQHVAEKYAQGGGDVKPSPAETISVLLEVELTNARDIEVLSGTPKNEYEVLILPGAKFQVTQVMVAPNNQRPEGTPPATEWYVVKLKQVV